MVPSRFQERKIKVDPMPFTKTTPALSLSNRAQSMPLTILLGESIKSLAQISRTTGMRNIPFLLSINDTSGKRNGYVETILFCAWTRSKIQENVQILLRSYLSVGIYKSEGFSGIFKELSHRQRHASPKLIIWRLRGGYDGNVPFIPKSPAQLVLPEVIRRITPRSNFTP